MPAEYFDYQILPFSRVQWNWGRGHQVKHRFVIAELINPYRYGPRRVKDEHEAQQDKGKSTDPAKKVVFVRLIVVEAGFRERGRRMI